jgi:hypothetical protein
VTKPAEETFSVRCTGALGNLIGEALAVDRETVLRDAESGGAGLYGRPLSLYARLSPAIEVVSAFRRTDSRCRGGPNHFGVDVEAIYGRRGTRVDERAV